MDLAQEMLEVRRDIEAVEKEIATVIVGQTEVIRSLLTALLADGHVLVEGLPGLGKTLMVTTIRDVLDLAYSRIQFTPDLMPADITGTTMIDTGEERDREFRFERGPIFTNVLLADEINRASPKTQSALLQAMQEREVTVFGRHYALDDPFCVIATQNPIEMAGTYPLPEAQLDRFVFKVIVRPPDLGELILIAGRTTGPRRDKPRKVIDASRLRRMRDIIVRIPVADQVMNFAARLVLATHPDRDDSPKAAAAYIRYGASPRGLQALIGAAKVAAARDGRFHVSREDITAYLLPALRHRIILNFEAELQKVRLDDLLMELSATVAS